MIPEPGCSTFPDGKNGILKSFTCDGSTAGDSFLIPHRHDLAMRSILDPNQVYETILLQAEILSRRAEFLYREQGLDEVEVNNDIENNSFGAVSDEEYAPSNYAPSVYTEGGKSDQTSYSVATRIAGNYDKFSQAKRKYNKPKPPQLDLKPRSTTRGRVMGTIHDNGTARNSADEKSHASQVLESNPTLVSLVACMGETTETQTRYAKEEFYNVLQLKMKLNLAEYYQNEYLSMFPSSPTPPGFINRKIPNKKDAAPSLSRSTSSSDSSSRDSATKEVAFGSGISSSTIRLLANDSSFLDLAITGSLGLIDRGGASSRPKSSPSRQKSPSHYIVLIHRRSGVPLAVCALKSHHGPPVVRIYATKSRVVGQRPAASTEQLGLNWIDSPYPLFAWAEFTTEGEFPMPVRYSLYMASGSDGHFEKEPSYRASHPSTGSPDIAMVGRTQTETDYTGCALFSVVSDDSQDDGEPFFSLSISRGIDPALMICFAAIVDETIEKTMRVNCDMTRTRRLARGSRSKSSWN